MKIAYLILVHKDPVLLARTTAALSSENCGFFIYVDGKSDLHPFLNSTKPNEAFCQTRIPVFWGEFSQVEATIQLIRQALASPIPYERLVFLQGGTYPLRSREYVEQFFAENSKTEFMNLVRMPAPGYPLSKINTIRYPSDKPIRRFASRALAKMGLARRDYRKYLGDLEPYAGHACWALSRKACEYVLDFTAGNQKVSSYFANTFAPDESFFHTIIGNSPFRALAQKIPVYADWSNSIGHHPDTLDDEHLLFFERQTKVWIKDEWGAGEMLFARKFSEARLDLVDRTDQMISRKDSAMELR